MEKLASTVNVYDDLMRDVDTLRRFNIAAGTYMYSYMYSKHIAQINSKHALTPQCMHITLHWTQVRVSSSKHLTWKLQSTFIINQRLAVTSSKIILCTIVHNTLYVPIDLSTSVARVMMAADFTMDNISAPLLANNATADDELAYNSTREQVNLAVE